MSRPEVALEVLEILKAQEMRGEKMVNHFRFAYSLLGLGLLASVHGVNQPAANLVYLWQGLSWLVYSLTLYLVLGRLAGRHLGWLKYVTVTLDILLSASTILASAANHSGVLEYFLSFMPQLGVFWNVASGFRLSAIASVYSALLNAIINGCLVFWAATTGLVAVSSVSVFGSPAINFSDMTTTIVFIALPGFLSAFMAHIARRLVRRAEEESLKRARMEKERNRLGRYLSKNLVDLILQDPDKLELGGARRQATIMFTDIRNFTPFSETHEPEEVVGFLNDYFTRMHEIVCRYGGTLDKYLGDGLMVEFGIPIPGYQAPLRAVIAALEMVQTVREMNLRARTPGTPEIEIGAGIVTGLVVAGDIGSLERMEYTCIGDTVNFAARLESMNRRLGACVTICGATLLAMPQGILGVQTHENAVVKGKRDPVTIHSLAIGDDLPGLIESLRRELGRVEASP